MKNLSIYRLLLLVVLTGFVLFFESCFSLVMFEAPDAANAGQAIMTTVRLKTTNNYEAGDVIKVRYYISSDRFFDRSDDLLHTQNYTQGIDYTSYVDISAGFSIPVNLRSGEYYLVAIVNGGTNVSIIGDGVNIYARKINIIGNSQNRPDLLVNNFFASNSLAYYDTPTFYPGASLPLVYSMENRGSEASPQTQVRYYLSGNIEFSLNDPTNQLIGEQTIESVAAAERIEIRSQVNIPQPSDGYGLNHLHLVIDFWNNANESNEDNNIASKLLNIRQKREDQSIERINTPGLLLSGEDASINGQARVTNRIGLFDTQVGVYLSEDDQWSSSDQQIGTFGDSGGTTSFLEFEGSFFVPSGVPTGTYFVIARVNSNQAELEYDYSNNNKAIRVFIVNNNFSPDEICDDVMQSIDLGHSAIAQETAQNRHTLENKAAQLEVAVYPNPAADFVNLNIELTQPSKIILAQLFSSNGESVQQVIYYDMPAGKVNRSFNTAMLSRGSYFIKIQTDESMVTKPLTIQ